ncbi:protein of unknown function [Cupriavidus taiwanensis]|uniref:Uncharacterized protein n=1 Tax=Cupriavidus taiwanensis TaxID=164546 RepID=A0A375IFZ4_9BURK|nr:protein of unknown function [Cupriavidus taiwanensis]
MRVSADRSTGGRVIPREAERRRIPAQAFALKKYRCGTLPASKTADNEDAAALLWNSEVLSVKNSVGEPIPEFCQAPEEGAKIPPFVTRQDTGHVFPNEPAGAISTSNRNEDPRQVATRIVHAAALAGDAE